MQTVAIPAFATDSSESKASPAMPSSVSFEPVSFDELPGWRDDDHLAAWKAFLVSCGPTLKAGPKAAKPGSAGQPQKLLDICARALAIDQSGDAQTRDGARAFFETYFRPNRIAGSDNGGLLTGYFEPEIKGSRTPDETYKVPIYRRPPDLVNIVSESERGARSSKLTHRRKTEKGLVPYLTRKQIEEGGLSSLGLEILYLKDQVDAFFMQVQGSGRIELPNGEKVRITYDGKNGYPYTSIGRLLIEAGHVAADEMSLKTLKKWLKADEARAKPVMRKNRSYVFFKELTGEQASAPVGVYSIPLQPLRSLAIDTSYYAIGTPIYVDAPQIKHATPTGAFRRLMIAHDVGSAIKGSERGDIFFGTGDKAGRLAGVTKEPGHFYALLPLAGTQAPATASGGP